MPPAERLIEFAGNHPELFIALAVVLALLAWTSLRPRMLGYAPVGPLEATQLINHQDAVVLDVREDSELKDGRIIDSVHVPLGQLGSQLARLERYKDRPVIVSCRSGNRSGAACAALRRGGFTQVYNLQGGILAWQHANLPLVKR